MAQQITIDIVAETKKLTSGIQETNSQIDGMSSKLKGAAAAATAAASAFVLKQGISFLKDGIKEAEDAKKAMEGATSAFGAGSTALQKITDDATKFGKELGMDNDDIIKLATSIGVRLPKDAQGASAELVLLAKNLEASSAGAIGAETTLSKLGKAFKDGTVTVKELQGVIPGLDAATYALAETMSKAGDNQGALTLLIDAGQKKYGGAAAAQVTATQKFDTALADLKETIGTKILPMINKFIDTLTILIGKFTEQPALLQNIELGLAAIIGIGGPFLGFLASAKTSLAVLGITQSATTAATAAGTVATELSTVATTQATIAQRLLNITMLAAPWLLVIAGIALVVGAIILLVKNWDTVTEVVGKVWDAIKNFASDAWDALKSFGSRVSGFVSGIVDKFNDLPSAMLNVGKNIITGLWDGITSMISWFEQKLANSLVGKTISKVMSLFGVHSPSTVFAGIGKNLVAGLAQGMDNANNIAMTSVNKLANSTTAGFVPKLNFAGASNTQAPISITINAGLGTNGADLGRQVSNAIKQYGKVSNRVKI